MRASWGVLTRSVVPGLGCVYSLWVVGFGQSCLFMFLSWFWNGAVTNLVCSASASIALGGQPVVFKVVFCLVSVM